MVFVFFFQYTGRFLAETFVAGTTSNFAQFEVVLFVGCFYPRGPGGLMCCGVFSILLESISNFSNVSDALTNRGLGVAGWYAYSFVLFGSTHKGRMECLEFVMIRIVIKVSRLDSHKTCSVQLITNSPRASFVCRFEFSEDCLRC
jgi:hypothetical protein